MLTIRDVHKSYGDVQALRGDAGMRVARFSLLGPNGAGKSTTVGVATGLLAPDSGSVELLGVGSPRLARVRRHLGVAPQSIAVYEPIRRRKPEVLRADVSVAGVGPAGPGGDVAGSRRSDASGRGAGAALLGRHEAPAEPRDRVDSRSGGRAARRADCRVDPQSRNAILELVRELGDEGKAVVYSTHYMEEAQHQRPRRHTRSRAGDGHRRGRTDQRPRRGHRVRRDSPAGTETVQTKDPLPTLAGMLAEPETLAIHVDRPDLEAVFLNLRSEPAT